MNRTLSTFNDNLNRPTPGQAVANSRLTLKVLGFRLVLRIRSHSCKGFARCNEDKRRQNRRDPRASTRPRKRTQSVVYMSGPERVRERARHMLCFYMSGPERVRERAWARFPNAVLLYERARHAVWAF